MFTYGYSAAVNELRNFLNAMPIAEQEAFALRCGTTIGYLRKVCSTGQRIGESIVINIERETDRVIRCERLRPDVDWAYLRSSPAVTTEPAQAGV